MKNVCVLIGICSFATVAQAQSSVTLYGILDEGVNYTSNAGGSRLFNMSSGVLQGSRFGLRGTQDLGGGLKALFVLENGYDVGTGRLGQGGLLFGRQAYLGLSSIRVGTVSVGRQYDSVVDYVGPLGAGEQWGGYIIAHPGDLDNLNNAYRANNTVKYTSQSYAGFTFGGTYSIGGVPGQISANQIWSAGAAYKSGNVSLAAAYLNARTPSNAGALFGNNTTSATASSVTTPVYSGYVSANTYQVAAAGAAYTIGAATIGATYSNIRFLNLGANGQTAYARGENVTFNNAELNFKYQVTPALLLGLAFDYTRGNNVELAGGGTQEGANYYQGAVGADYFLSKRTDFYTTAVYQKASGVDSRGREAVAALTI